MTKPTFLFNLLDSKFKIQNYPNKMKYGRDTCKLSTLDFLKLIIQWCLGLSQSWNRKKPLEKNGKI